MVVPVVDWGVNMENKMETKTRIRFSKTGTLCFIGHLDFLRVFQQTIRRSGLPIAYSQGFNPHQIISFALPLSLGMESINDYADITLTENVPYNEIVDKINAVAPQGLTVTAAYRQQGAAAAAATIVADYKLVTDAAAELTNEAIKNVLNSKTLVIPKKTKSGIKNTDIRSDIFEISYNNNAILLRLSAGSGRFLNPLLVAELLLPKGSSSASNISRLEIYQADGNGGITPL